MKQLAFLVSIGFSLICLASTATDASTPSHLWSQSFGSTGTDKAYCCAVDASGNLFVTGVFFGTVNFGGTNLVSAGSSDIFLAKYDANGIHLWSRRFGSTSVDPDFAFSCGVDATGGVAITGRFVGTVDFGGGPLVSTGAADIFLAKYDTFGSHQWSQRFGSTHENTGACVRFDESGNVLLTGQVMGAVNFGGGDLVGSGFDQDMYLAKFDASGIHQWSHRFVSGNGVDGGTSVAVNSVGEVYATGYFGGTVNFGGADLESVALLDIVLAKFNADGTHQWSRGFGGAGIDIGTSVAVDGAGNVFATGTFQQGVNFGGEDLSSDAGSWDVFLAKYDASSNHQWSQRFGGSGSDFGNAVVVDVTGSVFGTGYFEGTVNFGGDDRVSLGSTDIFLMKHDADGLHQWSERFGDTNQDEGRAVAVDASGNVVATGYFQNTADFGGDVLVSAGGADVHVVKYGATSTDVVAQRFAFSVSNYPNPFNPRTTVSYTVPSRGNVTVTIYEARGARVATLVRNESLEAGAYRLEWNGRTDAGATVSSGVYFARIEHDGVVRSRKMVLLK